MPTPAAQPDFFQSFHGALPPFAQGHQRLGVKQRQFHVILGRGAGQQIETLEHKAQLLVPQFCQFPAIQTGHRHPIQPVSAAGGLVQASEGVHQGGLARTACAHDGHEFAALDVERHSPDRLHFHLAGLVGFHQLAEFYDRSIHKILTDWPAADRRSRRSWFHRQGSASPPAWLRPDLPEFPYSPRP